MMTDENQHSDAFEDRLRDITPAAPSQALRERLTRQMDVAPSGHGDSTPRHLRRLLFMAGGGAAAACLTFAIWLAVSGPTPDAAHDEVLADDGSAAPVPEEPRAHEDTPPRQPSALPDGTLLVYHHAIRDSPATAITVFDTPPAMPGNTPAPRDATLRAMDTAMFLHDDERCDG